MEINLKEIPLNHGLVISLYIVCAVAPALIGLFLYNHDIFQKTDTIKLILITVSLNAPFLLYSLIPAYLLFEFVKNDGDDILLLTVTSGVFLTLSVWLVIAIVGFLSYAIFDYVLSYKILISAFLFINTVFIGILIFAFIGRKNLKK